jgi:hypothetical protein
MKPAGLLLLAALGLLFSCEDTAPVMQNVQFKAVFDYSADSPTRSYALLFVQPDTDIDLRSKVCLENIETGYTWTIYDLTVLRSGDKAWTGTDRLAYPEGAFRRGLYRVRYIDTAERESDLAVSLEYPPGLVGAGLGEVRYLIPGYEEKFALYDADETLIFFDNKKAAWTNDGAILSEFPKAAFSRECLVSPSAPVVVLLPLRALAAS